MEKRELAEYVKALDPEATVTEGKQFVEVTIPPSRLHAFMKMLREKDETFFDYMMCLTGTDYKDGLGVVYHLNSTKYRHSIVVKTKTAERSDPSVATVSDIWRTAEYHEREVFDLLGIKFENHPDLRRFFLEKNYGYPLRKDFTDEINIVSK